MFKKLCSIIILLSLLYSDIAYPLNNASSFQDEGFRKLISILSSIKNIIDIQELSEKFGVKVQTEGSSVCLDYGNWKIRFFKPSDREVKIEDGYELVWEQEVVSRLKARVYFKGLIDEDKDRIREYLANAVGISALGEMVLKEVIGDAGTSTGRTVRREVSGETAQKLEKFLDGLGPQVSIEDTVNAIIKKLNIEGDQHTRKAIRDYLWIFIERRKLKQKMGENAGKEDLFILKKISDLAEDEIFRTVMGLFTEAIAIRKNGRILIKPSETFARIEARAEGLKEKNINQESTISFTWGNTIYFNEDCRFFDFIVYFLHEIIHLAGGMEADAKIADKEILAILKGIIGLLREIKVDEEKGKLLNDIANVMEYEVLGCELDLHTAKLEVSGEGKRFLNHFDLAGINILPPNPAYVRAMIKNISGVIREKEDKELFDEIRRIISMGNENEIRTGMFLAFAKYIKKLAEKRIQEAKKVLKEEEPEFLEPVYESSVLAYTITEKEAKRRLNEVVLNPNAPLFARVNDAIMIDMFGESEKVEFNAVEQIRKIMDKEPKEALQILEELRNKKSVELISEFLNDRYSEKIRAVAAERLFNIVRSLTSNSVFYSPKTIKNLLDFINRPKISEDDPDLNAVLQIVTVLSCIRCKDAVPFLLNMLEQNESYKVKKFVAGALGSMGDTSVIPQLKKRIWEKGDINNMRLCIYCLEELPNDKSAKIIMETFLKTKNKDLKLFCLKALESVIKKKRISLNVTVPIIEPLMEIIVFNKSKVNLNSILGRIASIAIQEGRLDLFENIKAEILSEWINFTKKNVGALLFFSTGLIHDTFMDIQDLTSVDKNNPLKGIFNLVLEKFIGNWSGAIEYLQELKDAIYKGRKEYTDIVWKEIAQKLKEIKPDSKLVIGRQWFQRMCLGIAYRVLLDTWDIGRIEDRDYILELMILRSFFVTENELPEGAIGATEAFHGDYVLLDNSFFSTPKDIPGGVNTVWHEATHLLSIMGIADIADVNLLGASSHSNIEFYLLSEIFGLPKMEEIVKRLQKRTKVEDLMGEYEKYKLSDGSINTIKAVLQGMAVRDKADGPQSAFFMVRNIKPWKVKKWEWDEVLRRLKKINVEIIDTYTIRKKQQILVHTYLYGARFSGYAQRIGIETGYPPATNIYVELLVRYRMRPAQAEFIARTVARFMMEEQDILRGMENELIRRCRGIPQFRNVPLGEIDKWLKRYTVEKVRSLALKNSGKAEMQISYDDLNKLVSDGYKKIVREMKETRIQNSVLNKALSSIIAKRRIFRAKTRGKKVPLVTITHVVDTEGESRVISWHVSPDSRYVIIVEADFGEGNEVYAYVDTERKEIKLANPDNDRIPLEKISGALGMDLKVNNLMQIDMPRDKKYFQWSLWLKSFRGINWNRIRKHVFFGALFISIFVLSSILNLSGVEWGLMLAAAILIIIESRIIWKIIFEDIEYKLSKELKKKLKENGIINKGVRRFIDDLYNGNLATSAGRIFLISDFNRVLLAYDREGLVNLFNREFGIDERVSSKVIDYGLRALEYKEKADIGDLMSMTMTLHTEEIISSIANGNCVFRTKEQKLKKIGIAECFNYARKGNRGLYRMLCNSYKIGRIRKIPSFIAEDATNIIYDIYLSLEKKEGKESLAKFAEKIIQLDVSNYIMPPLTRYKLIKEFKARGIKFLETEVSKSRKEGKPADGRIFDAVLDTLGIDMGLEFLRNTKEESSTSNTLSNFLFTYLSSFEIGPNGYIPVQILDAWGSFNLWKKRRGEFTYEDTQREFIRLYMKYIKNQKGDMPKWGWTFLWLGYFEKGTRMNDAVLDLLKLLIKGEDVDNTDINKLCEKYKLGLEEKNRFRACMPIDGFITMVEIYCKDIVWGRQNLAELEEGLKRNMNVVLDKDIANEEIYNSEVDKWIYTFRNVPCDLREKIKGSVRKEVIDLILDRITESGIVVDKDVFRGELYRIFDLIFATRLPENGERFVDCISTTGLCKVLFDYAKNTVKDWQKLRKSHFVKNKEVSKKESARFKGKSKDDILLAAFSGEGKKEFKEYSRNNLAEFYNELGKSKKLVIFAHRHTETIGLLYWIRDILKENPSLEVRIVPQKSLWELNSTKEDIMAVLNDKEMGLQELLGFREKGRFTVSDDCAGGFSWLNCPEKVRVKEELKSDCIVLGAGWDNFVSMQGLNRPCYFVFGVDSQIKQELTGCETNKPVFVKTCGGIPATKIGVYNLHEYLENTNSTNYIELLSYFGGNRIKLHEWIKIEAKRVSKREMDVMADNSYCGKPVEMFGRCALRNIYADIRDMAMHILLNNHGKFGIRKEENINELEINGITIQIDKQVDVYSLPSLKAVIVVSNGKRLIVEIIEGEGGVNYLRIGDMVYGITKDAEVNLNSLVTEPALWIGNSELVEFFGIDGKNGFREKERAPSGVFLKDVPHQIIRKISTTMPPAIYKKAEDLLAQPIECLPLRLHYVIVLLSSADKNQCVKGLAELEKLRTTGDSNIIELMKLRGVKRVGEWVLQEVPTVDRDVYHLSNFTIEQERILRVLYGSHLLRPPLVEMPGQGVSARFHGLMAEEMQRFGIDLERSNYAEGVGSVLFEGGRRHFIYEGDLLLGLVERLMPGAFRLNRDGNEIIQLPNNSSILNYLKAIHHLAHITSAKLIESRGGEPDPLQEFTPSIEDILVIKYAERIAKELGDGFINFKREVANANSKEELSRVFTRYGLNVPSGKDFSEIKIEIDRIKDMLGFSDYIMKNNLGHFISAKEFLNVLIDYKKDTMKDYIRQLPPTQQIILEKLLSAKDSKEINSLLIIASFLAGCYIPKVDFERDIDAIMEILGRQNMTQELDRNEMLNKIDNILESGEPFSAKAVGIVGTILYNIGLKVNGEERRRIEQEVMDILSGKWWQEIGESLMGKISELEGEGVNVENLRIELDKIRTYKIGEPRKLSEAKPIESKDIGVESIDSWDNIVNIVDREGIKRVFFDIDKTTIDAVGFLTTTPWFTEMTKQEGLDETIRQWRDIEEGQIQRESFHLMEGCILQVVKELKKKGVEIYFYTARGEEDLDRTKRILTCVGIDLNGIEIITSKGGTSEQKRDALVEYYRKKGWFKGRRVPSLFMDDTLANVRTICGDGRFSHIKGWWYRSHYEKRYDDVDVEGFLDAGEKALDAKKPMEALEWYLNAFYFRTRKDIANQVYDTVLQNVGFGSSIEEMFYIFIKDRLNRYKSAVEREEVWIKPEPEEEEIKEPVQIEPAPDMPDSSIFKGVKRIIVIGSHPHGDHIKGFLDYAKRRIKNIVQTPPPGQGERKTGGSITHSLSNYWGRIDSETIVLFDLGWFPEGFVDPLIQTISPGDREIVFIMDPDTERTMGFEKQLKRLNLKGVKLEKMDYNQLIKIPIENGKKILEIENYPAYHLAKEVGSSIYMIRVRDKKTGKVLHSIGYVSELGDIFPEKMDKDLLEKLARLDRIIVDGTNLIAPMGEEPLPLKENPNKVHEYVEALNQGKFLISHFNTTSIRMGEEAEVVSENLDSDIPIVIIGGKDSIEQLKRSYKVPKERDYYTIGKRKVYLVHDVAGFHRRLREEGLIPKLGDVLEERKQGLKKAGWTDAGIDSLVNEWRKNDNQEITEYKGPEGKVKELTALFWDLRKTKAVVISSSQFRGNPACGMYKNFKGFQILDAIVNRKEASILVEGRLHMEEEEGVVLRELFSKKKEKEIISITGRKKVRATIDKQWRSGHITFGGLKDLSDEIADTAVKLGNVYNTRTFIPVPKKEWLDLVAEKYKIGKFGRGDIKISIKIINRWNSNKNVSYEDMQFVRKVMKEILENDSFFHTCLGIEGAEELRRELLERLERIEKESKLQGRVNIRIFVASTSKFIDVLRKQILMNPQKKSELFRIVDRFSGFEVGVSYEAGVTIDLVRREKEEYSRDLKKELNREYLQELYELTSKGEIPPDLSRYHDKKGLEEYRSELGEIIAKAKTKSARRGKDLSGEWPDELKRYIESQYLRIGLRYADGLAPYSELRKELTCLYDAVIESVYNFLQEDMQWKYKDIAIIACGDYANMKTLFKDTIRLGIMTGSRVDVDYVKRLSKGMEEILNKLGIPVKFDTNWQLYPYKRAIISYSKDVLERLKRPVGKDILDEREKRLSKDLNILKERKGFDIHEGPGGLDDIDLIRYFFGQNITNEEKEILNEAEEFLRRYKEEIGLSTGGEKGKAKALLDQIMNNIGFSDGEGDFMDKFFKKVFSVYTIFLRFTGRELQFGSLGSRRMETPPPISAGIPPKSEGKNISFGVIDEGRDIHEGVFEKAKREGRLFSEKADIADDRVKQGFRLIRDIIKGNTELESRIYKIVIEEEGKPTMFYCEDPFSSVLSHSGRRTNTTYLGLNTLMAVIQNSEHRGALRNILRHDNRDIKRGYHMDLEDEVREGLITYEDVDGIYRVWNDLITNGRFSVMYNLYMERSSEEKYSEYFLDRIPANIRITKGEELYEFKHGDMQNLPDFIGLNLRLFSGRFSPETQVFLLRHCTDRIRYDRYKTIINDVKYLLTIGESERVKIIIELGELEYVKFLERVLKIEDLLKKKEEIRKHVGLVFGTYKSPDGADITYTIGGKKDEQRTLVFLHGLGVNSRDWRHQITLFEEGYRIITIDLRGFGKSKGLGSNSPDIRNYAKDVEGVLKQEGITDAILVGHSMGGMAALNMDELYENIPLEDRRIKGLVLIATDVCSPISESVRRIVLRFMKSRHFERIWGSPIFKWLIKKGLAPGIAELLGITQRETHPLFTKKVISSVFKSNKESLIYAVESWGTHDVENKLGILNIPVLWIIGEKDRATQPEKQREQSRLIRDCTVVSMPDAGHYPHATFPRRVNREINRFINEGTYKFSQLVCKEIKQKFGVDVSLNDLETNLQSLKMRLVPKFNGIQADGLRLIDDISRIVMEFGLQTGVSYDVMIKAVIIVASQILPKLSIEPPPAKPITNEEIEGLYESVVRSA